MISNLKLNSILLLLAIFMSSCIMKKDADDSNETAYVSEEKNEGVVNSIQTISSKNKFAYRSFVINDDRKL